LSLDKDLDLQLISDLAEYTLPAIKELVLKHLPQNGSDEVCFFIKYSSPVHMKVLQINFVYGSLIDGSKYIPSTEIYCIISQL
jgi:hypothetical protein